VDYNNTLSTITFVIMHKNIIIGLLITVLLFTMNIASYSQSDTMGIDTTGLQYRIGYQLGSWLPFIIIALMMALVTIRGIRISRQKNASLYDKY
jgi:hypothetical protein